MNNLPEELQNLIRQFAMPIHPCKNELLTRKYTFYIYREDVGIYKCGTGEFYVEITSDELRRVLFIRENSFKRNYIKEHPPKSEIENDRNRDMFLTYYIQCYIPGQFL